MELYLSNVMPRFKVPVGEVRSQRSRDPRFVPPILIGKNYTRKINDLKNKLKSLQDKFNTANKQKNDAITKFNQIDRELKDIFAGEDWLIQLPNLKNAAQQIKNMRKDAETREKTLKTLQNKLDDAERDDRANDLLIQELKAAIFEVSKSVEAESEKDETFARRIKKLAAALKKIYESKEAASGQGDAAETVRNLLQSEGSGDGENGDDSDASSEISSMDGESATVSTSTPGTQNVVDDYNDELLNSTSETPVYDMEKKEYRLKIQENDVDKIKMAILRVNILIAKNLIRIYVTAARKYPLNNEKIELSIGEKIQMLFTNGLTAEIIRIFVRELGGSNEENATQIARAFMNGTNLQNSEEYDIDFELQSYYKLSTLYGYYAQDEDDLDIRQAINKACIGIMYNFIHSSYATPNDKQILYNLLGNQFQQVLQDDVEQENIKNDDSFFVWDDEDDDAEWRGGLDEFKKMRREYKNNIMEADGGYSNLLDRVYGKGWGLVDENGDPFSDDDGASIKSSDDEDEEEDMEVEMKNKKRSYYETQSPPVQSSLPLLTNGEQGQQQPKVNVLTPRRVKPKTSSKPSGADFKNRLKISSVHRLFQHKFAQLKIK